MEILRVFAEKYAIHAYHLQLFCDLVNENGTGEYHDFIVSQLESLRDLCISGELPVTKIAVEGALVAFSDEKNYTPAVLKTMLDTARGRLTDELSTKLFLQVPYEKKQYFDSPLVGWEHVVERFPDTVLNISEMSKCFALSRYAAAVFHSLLVVENGLIELGKIIGVSDPKPGWDATYNRLKRLVADGRAKLPQEFPLSFSVLEQTSQCVESMKLAWRNKVNHSAGQLVVMQPEFTPDIAEEIMVTTRGFMRRLATDLPVQKKLNATP